MHVRLITDNIMITLDSGRNQSAPKISVVTEEYSGHFHTVYGTILVGAEGACYLSPFIQNQLGVSLDSIGGRLVHQEALGMTLVTLASLAMQLANLPQAPPSPLFQTIGVF